MSRPPCLALTLGDPAGIGPEIAMRLLSGEGELPARLLLVGDLGTLAREAEARPGARPPPVVGEPRQFADGDEPVGLWCPAAPIEPLNVPGRIDREAGGASHAWVLEAARLCLDGTLDGVVTGPIHKEAWRRAGVEAPGHTEALAAAARCERVLMLLVGARLRAALATIHVPLRSVPGLLRTDELAARIELLSSEVARLFGPSRPRIAVAGLNPHAGEGGLFGREDLDVIRPAVERARDLGVDAHGPLPADACIPAASEGRYDAVLAMYHDQALPAVKALAPRRAVNVTLGLPFVRTSVDHGTAFDIAGRGRATASSLRAAVELAARMVARTG